MQSKALFQIVPILLAVVALWVCSVSGEIYFKKGAPHVQLANNALLSGKVQFSREGRPYNAFKGIQYARIPERFAESEPVPAWDGVKSVTEFGPSCIQQGLFVTAQEGEEDCLFLNVYVPMNNTGKRGYPIMVWVHGGGFLCGNSHTYGERFFMDQDVILVSLNYRVGVFGFLSTGDEVVPGNNGLKDQVMALKWIQENIRRFGGDSGKVTVFGESAGGASTNYLLLSPTTKGLIHRVISQSGSALGLWAFTPDPKSNARNLANHLKCPTTAADSAGISSEEILTCLKSLSMEDLNKAQYEFDNTWPVPQNPLFFKPVKEPVPSITTKYTPFMTESPWELLSDNTKTLAEIPFMVGVTEHEGATVFAGFVLSQPAYLEEMTKDWDKMLPNALMFDRYFSPEEEKTVADKLKEFYFGGKAVSLDTRESLVNLYSDTSFTFPALNIARETARRRRKSSVYLYQYTFPGPMQVFGGPHMVEPESKLVSHGDELQHLFTLKDLIPGYGDDIIKPDTPEEEFSKNLVRLWVSFAVHGEPKHNWGEKVNANVSQKWRGISPKELNAGTPLKWYKIDNNPGFIEEPNPERMAFWDKLWTDHFSAAVTKQRGTLNSKTEL